jgi:ferredoxin
LLKEHRIKRENVYVIGIPCVDFVQVPEGGSEADAKPLEKCATCKSTKHVVYDELIGEEGDVKESSRFDQVAELEKMNPEERYNFWRNELSRCIRCNACRNVCPACTCETCIFDNPNSGIAQKAAADTFEENMFHIIRAFHVTGRCTDCGECSRVCPQNIPLHLLNRKFIKDINELYGDFQAGEDTETRAPLNIFNTEDVEPSIVHERANEKEGN